MKSFDVSFEDPNYSLALSSTPVCIAIFGHPSSEQATFVTSFLRVENNMPDISWVKNLRKIIQMDNETYLINVQTGIGQESYFGVMDSVFRIAQGFIYLYNITSRESWDVFGKIREKIYRVKQMEHIPIILVGFSVEEKIEETRQVTTEEARRFAAYIGCRFREVVGINLQKIDDCFFELLREILSFYSGAKLSGGSIDGLEVDEEMKHREVGILVAGDCFVGKTTLVKRLTGNIFPMKYTESTDFSIHKHAFQFERETYMLSVVDTPGLWDDEFSTELLLNVQGIVFVYSISARPSFLKLKTLRTLFLKVKGTPKIPMIVLGNKLDDADIYRQVTTAEGQALADSFGAHFMEVSLKDKGYSAKEAFDYLVKEIIRSNQSFMTVLDVMGDLNRSGQLLLGSRGGKWSPIHAQIKDGILTTNNPKYTAINISLLPICVEIDHANVAPNRFSFTIRIQDAKEKRIMLASATEQDRNEWINTIKVNIAISEFAFSLIDEVVTKMIIDQIPKQFVRNKSFEKMDDVIPETYAEDSEICSIDSPRKLQRSQTLNKNKNKSMRDLFRIS